MGAVPGPGGRQDVATTEDRQDAAQALIARTLAAHHDELRRTARRHSLCEDDAADALQRALELFLRHAARLEPADAHRWLFTVTKREAWAVRAERQRLLPGGSADEVDRSDTRHVPPPDERLLERERLDRTTEALGHLKPAELQALWLKAAGASYEEIARDLGWTRTKVNRSLAEGRARLRARIAGIESGEECDRWRPLLGALRSGRAAPEDLVAARRHVRNCPACRAELRTAHRSRGPLALAPLAVGLWVALQERAVGSAARAQAAVEALTGGKAAAVAASAAAIAGGGAVAVERVVVPPRGAQQERAARPGPPTEPPARAARARPVTVPAATVATAARTAVSRPVAPTVDPDRGRTRRSARRTATAASSGGGGEFGPGTLEDPGPAERPAPAVVPRAAVASARAAQPAPPASGAAAAPAPSAARAPTRRAPSGGDSGDLLP
ncbi:hypothetical protein C7Y72_15765 [Paraconexibacter algicola]|uniref:RNA polymerase sigma factor 70 region 4 type 2 domain-containing protein n=1 Tax=Paraconexibacter algicola TaxID=2133960 RepID=A0A2T4UF68_9ACTN|nr:hypothetical protein C7Y72_15765 [Paraconexibacter algicola]